MTREQLRRTLFFTVLFFILALFSAVVIFHFDHDHTKTYYDLFHDLIPLIIAIPAAYLGFCFQRRSSFLQALRLLWSNLIISVNAAIQYTHLEETTPDKYAEILVMLSKSIDEVRGVYKNVKSTELPGKSLYPFESLKDMHRDITNLGYGTIDKKAAKEIRNQIIHNWKDMRETFLSEFDRFSPTIYHTPYR